VKIKKKEITAPITSSKSSLRKSGSINCCLRMDHLQSHCRSSLNWLENTIQ